VQSRKKKAFSRCSPEAQPMWFRLNLKSKQEWLSLGHPGVIYQEGFAKIDLGVLA
jgi:hypothetical protein